MVNNKIQEIRNAERANGPALILGIGTSNPPNEMNQTDYPDYYFRVTKSEHMTDLKAKFKRICEKSTIKKRYLHVTEDILKDNLEMVQSDGVSLKIRQEAILAKEVPKLGYEAATKAMKEWGQPKSMITHVIFATNSDVDNPGSDYHLVNLLGLEPTVKRFMLRQGGCHAGGTILRIAKDIVENNRGARVLAVCSESTAICYHEPSWVNLVPHALFGDGAGAVVVGADPDEPTERPIFQLVSAGQTTLPSSGKAIQACLTEFGMMGGIDPGVPKLISENIGKVVIESLKGVGVKDWNSVFWVAHPGGPAILDNLQAELKLETSKLDASRKVLSEYGNMWGATVIFIMDEMRKRSLSEGKVTTGEGLDWGVLFGFGPGITVETILLHSVPTIPLIN